MADEIKSLSASAQDYPGLKARANAKAAQYENIPQQFIDIAEGMETQFVEYMLKEMRKAAPSSEPASSATEYYNSLTDYERAKIISKTDNGIGLKDVILDQIYPKHMRVGIAPQRALNAYNQQEVDSLKGERHE